jgi:putative membrane-bound dehydrogenase-like protein
LAAGLCGLGLAVAAARGEFPQPYNTEPDTASAPLPPEVAAQRLGLPDGFHATVFAAEPDVQNPIAMAWDSRGRLWIAENYTYAERTQQFALDLQDRVLILDDTDGDGHCDVRSVFLDTVQRLTSVEVGHGGVWLMCPPQLLFVPDRDRDDRPDGPAEIVLDGFTVGHDNFHNLANGLRWGPDGWLYGRCGGSCPGQIGPPGSSDQQRQLLAGGIWRYHPTSGRVEVLNAGTTNPWGHDWNEVGEGFFINTVNGHLWHLIPGSHLDRPFAPDPNPRVYRLLDQHADHWHFDTGKTWQQSRDGAANDYGGGHAHVGCTIYLGDNWPDEFRGRLLTINIHGRRINQEILRRVGSGYLAGHGHDFCISADPWFRGMELSYGPDGAVYLLDWSDTGECHESTGVHRTSGRIFRVHYGDNPGNHLAGDLRRLTDTELAKLQRAKNEWLARQARLLLAERAVAGSDLPGVRQLLDQWLRSTSDGSLAVRCLLTLRAIRAVDDQRLAALL